MKITLIGRGPNWQDAPEDGETWGIHAICLDMPVKMVWHLHRFDDDDYEGAPEGEAKIVEYVNDNKIPMMCLKKHKNIPTSIAFPIDEMFPKYSESSMSYMIWYAIHIGATELDLYGIFMAAFDEYHEQLKSVEYWVGYARGRGIKVYINEPTQICKGRQGLYGYEFVNRRTKMGSVYQKEDELGKEHYYVLQKWNEK